jgi:hypothetical protein
MNSRKGRRRPNGKAIPKSKLSMDRRIVWVDQEPFRRDAASHCRREMKRIETARAQWRQFEQEDKPAFGRWMAATFGALLSEIRELGDLLQRNEALVTEVETEMLIRGSRSYAAAYDAIQRRKETPLPAQRSDDAEPPPGFDPGESDASRAEETAADGLSEFEQEFLFERFLEDVLGMDPDRLSDRVYRRMFADFQANLLGQDSRREAEPENPSMMTGPSAEPKSVNARVKEIYRLLVRRLHPDTRADTDVEVSALWHEVQEAYATGNLERLEMLVALTDIQAESMGEHTSLSQLRAVLKELRRSYQALQRSLSVARKELAWDFRNADLVRLEARMRNRMEQDRGRLREQCREVEAFIASWTERKRKRAKKGRRIDGVGQREFGF